MNKHMDNIRKVFVFLLIGNIFNLSFTEETCNPIVQLKDCNTKLENDPQWIWTRLHTYVIYSITQESCEDSTLEYQWIITDKNGNFVKDSSKFKNKPLFILDYFELDTGNWILKLTVKESKAGWKEGSSSAKCLITIRPEIPTPVILGGIYREVQSGKSFLMEGQTSINNNIGPGGNGTLNYRWFCTTDTTKTKFCSSKKYISLANQVEVPASAAIDTLIYEFELQVSAHDKKWFSTNQTVKVKKGIFNLYIICLKNCEGKVDYKSNVFLQIECSDCVKNVVKWSMKPDDKNEKKTIDFDKETEYGSEDIKLFIKKNVLVPGDNYTFIAEYDGGMSEARVKVKVSRVPSRGECTWNSTDGFSIKDTFSIECKGVVHTDPVTYRLYKGDPEKEQSYLVTANAEGKFEVRLPNTEGKQVDYYIKIVDIDGLYNKPHKQSVRVTSTVSNLVAAEKIPYIMDLYEGKKEEPSVRALFISGDYEGAIRLICMLTLEVKELAEDVAGQEEFRRKWQLMAITDLKEIPLDSQDLILELSSSLYYLESVIKHREFGVLATQMCKTLVTKQVEILKKSFDPVTMESDTETLSGNVLPFTLSVMEPNLKDLQHEKLITNYTTAASYLPFPAITENYPNYDDADLEYLIKLKDYQDISANSMEIFALMGLAILQTMALGEPPRAINRYDLFFLQFCVDEPRYFLDGYFGEFGSFVNGFSSISEWNGFVALVVVVFNHEKAYWWNKQNLSGHFLDINFYKDGKTADKLAKPMILTLEYPDDPIKKGQFKYIESSVTVPKDEKKWIPEYLDYNMTVHRIRAKRGATLLLRFKKLSQKCQIVVRYNRRPHWADFTNAIVVKKAGTTFEFPFPVHLLKFGDTFAYLAILPHKDVIKGSQDDVTVTYKLTFVTATCVRWNPSTKTWINTDTLSTNQTTSTQIVCECDHLSAFSGLYEYTSNKIDKLLPLIPFTLTLQPNYVIFICVYCICTIYCIALVFGVNIIKRQRKSIRKVMFLSDNAQSECYAYLIVVMTGNKYTAGTTSNVLIQLFGDKCESKVHILNYPDPSKKLLQRGKEDWFILTTDRHLGVIFRIHLWHDSVGQRPSWYCQWLTITDLQNLDEWYFNVQTWFSVTRQEDCKLVLEPSDPDAKSSRYNKSLLKFIKEQHTWNIRSYQGGLSYIQRITIMLSIVLTTYSLALIMYGVPKMRMSDALGYGHFQIKKYTITTAIASSNVSFCINLAFVLLLRMSNKDDNSVLNKYTPKLAWFLIIFTILASLTFLIVLGFWVQYMTSLLWLSSTVGALVQSILLLENVYLLLVTLLLKLEKVSVPIVNRSALIEEIEQQRKMLYSAFGEKLFRPYYKRKYRPLTREKWKKKREEELVKYKISYLLKDIIMFTIYIVVLYYVALANKDALDVYSNEEIRGIVHGLHTRTIRFDDIQNYDDFDEYITETLIANLFPTCWYGNWCVKDPGILSDFNTKILGVARFRQQRVCKHCCEVPDETKAPNLTCVPEFSYRYNDEGEYQEYWKRKRYELVPRLIGAWKYQDDAVSYYGDISLYPSGGYSGPLGRTVYNTFYNLQYYKDARWIDERTSTIFIEFLAYNCNFNVFHAITLIFERSVSGSFIKTSQIYTSRLLFVKFELEIIITIAFLVFIITVSIMFFKNINAARKGLKMHFKKTWNIVDIAISIMSFAYIGLYVHRSKLVGQLLDELEEKKHNEFISYFHLIRMEKTFTILAAVLICVATIRLWKLLRFGTVFKIMERTMMLSAKHLVSVSVCHMILLLMYSMIGYLVFGSYFKEFRSISVILTTLNLLSLNLAPHFDYELLENSDFGYLYYVSYMLVTMVIFTLYISVLTLGYEESCNFYSNVRPYYNIKRYIRDESRYIIGLFKKRVEDIRIPAGADATPKQKKVTPKDDKFRNAHSVTVSEHRLFVMSLIAKCVVYNQEKEEQEEQEAQEEDLDLMTQAAFYILHEDVPEPSVTSFLTTDEDGKRTFVTNERLSKMEYIANYLADKNTAMNSQKEEKREFDRTTVAGRLEYMEHSLKVLSDVLDNIEVKLY